MAGQASIHPAVDSGVRPGKPDLAGGGRELGLEPHDLHEPHDALSPPTDAVAPAV